MFEKLYDDEIISEDAFFMWEKNDDPSEQVSPLDNLTNNLAVTIFYYQEGKGVALKSCTQFLTWLREAENEDECDQFQSGDLTSCQPILVRELSWGFIRLTLEQIKTQDFSDFSVVIYFLKEFY